MKKFKMRSLVLVSIIVVLSSCSGGENDLEKSGLEGDISKVIENQYEAIHKDGEWSEGKPVAYGHMLILYDAAGNYVKRIALSERGDTLAYTAVRKENGETVEETFHSLVNGRKTRTIMERVDEKQVNFEVWEGETLHFEGASYFDKKGRLVSQVRVVEDREVMNHFVYDKRLMIKSFQEELNGQISGTQLYEYTEFDENGNWTKRLIYPTHDRIKPELVTIREYHYRQD